MLGLHLRGERELPQLAEPALADGAHDLAHRLLEVVALKLPWAGGQTSGTNACRVPAAAVRRPAVLSPTRVSSTTSAGMKAPAKPSELGPSTVPDGRLTGYDPAMELTVLGASGAWPAPGGAANGFLVRAGGYHLVLDFGMAVLPNLQRYLPHEQIDAIFISHEHWDHCLDLYPLFLARFFRDEPIPPLPVLAPAGVFDRLAALEDREGVLEM